MPKPPERPKIYHITHVDNLASIIAGGGLVSDAIMVKHGGPPTSIGMSSIKQRRLSLPLDCHPGDYVGDYVPFYFCPRSVMLYLIYCRNHPGLTYRGGQEPIVHLEANLREVVAWADTNAIRWAFTLSNAGSHYFEDRASLAELDQVDWPSVLATDFRSAEVKEGKQAEFLFRDSFPWDLVNRIGVHSATIQAKVNTLVQSASHRPNVMVQPRWYY